MFIGALIIGVLIAAAIPNKRQYNRVEFEKATNARPRRRSSLRFNGITRPVGDD